MQTDQLPYLAWIDGDASSGVFKGQRLISQQGRFMGYFNTALAPSALMNIQHLSQQEQAKYITLYEDN